MFFKLLFLKAKKIVNLDLIWTNLWIHLDLSSVEHLATLIATSLLHDTRTVNLAVAQGVKPANKVVSQRAAKFMFSRKLFSGGQMPVFLPLRTPWVLPFYLIFISQPWLANATHRNKSRCHFKIPLCIYGDLGSFSNCRFVPGNQLNKNKTQDNNRVNSQVTCTTC